ncbi:MAG TPA: hypothetical protein VGN26_07725 [Armatimonadota bacterium]|jgi:hypothetical protein
MVTYSESDLIPRAEFPFAWRLTDPSRGDIPSAEALARLHPLNDQRSREVWEYGSVKLRRWGPHALRTENYHAVSVCSLEGCDEADEERAYQWLRGLPVPLAEQVYVTCWREPPVVLATDWSTFTETWTDLWYPFDVVDVFDDSLEWAVLLGPEEFAVLAKRGAVPPELLEDAWATGIDLVRCEPPAQTDQ